MKLPLERLTCEQRLESLPLTSYARQSERFREMAQEADDRKVKNYYLGVAKLLEQFDNDEKYVRGFEKNAGSVEQSEHGSRASLILAKVTLFFNVSLFVAKTVASALSHSFSIITSTVDSAADITSGLIILVSNRAIKRRDLRIYPRGRTRLEPLALIFISFIMGYASVQIMGKSVEALVLNNIKPDVCLSTILIMAITIVVKIVLCAVCYANKTDQARVLAQDHRNDCLSNSVAIICAYLSDRFWKQLDPIGAILVSIYLVYSWMKTGYNQVNIISGRTAKPQLINRIIKISVDHSPRLQKLDTVYAYHLGSKFLVEVHVMLDGNMTLREAHDITEPLQRKLEYLPDVERAFVHADYEVDHRPEYEHKIV
ncbi:unnamed protein product [Soboliphyme baturini]|uniref:ZT_dimer domain-containing protein n=1 Tax=Soboliphyme baturini TaxID=241478 RepID=A0A183ILN1_9BILA|nr:unnamed protein product [Soboliphyme baturini]